MKYLTLLSAVLISASNLPGQIRPPAVPPKSANALKLLGKPTRSVNINAMVANVLKNPNPAVRKNLINFSRRTLTNPADLKKFDAAIAAATQPTPIPKPASAPAAAQQPPAARAVAPQTAAGTQNQKPASPVPSARPVNPVPPGAGIPVTPANNQLPPPPGAGIPVTPANNQLPPPPGGLDAETIRQIKAGLLPPHPSANNAPAPPPPPYNPQAMGVNEARNLIRNNASEADIQRLLQQNKLSAAALGELLKVGKVPANSVQAITSLGRKATPAEIMKLYHPPAMAPEIEQRLRSGQMTDDEIQERFQAGQIPIAALYDHQKVGILEERLGQSPAARGPGGQLPQLPEPPGSRLPPPQQQMQQQQRQRQIDLGLGTPEPQGQQQQQIDLGLSEPDYGQQQQQVEIPFDGADDPISYDPNFGQFEDNYEPAPPYDAGYGEIPPDSYAPSDNYDPGAFDNGYPHNEYSDPGAYGYGDEQNDPYAANVPTMEPGFSEQSPEDYEAALEQLEYGTRSIKSRRPENSQSTVPDEWQDPIFNRLVDITLLARGIQEVNSEFLTSAALQFLNAELVLQKSHKAITAEDLFRRAIDVVVSSKDTESLDRLKRAAAVHSNPKLKGIVDSVQALGGGSRTMSSVTQPVSLDDTSVSDFIKIKQLRKAVMRARLIGDQETIQSLEKQIEQSSLPSATKESLSDQIADGGSAQSTAKALKTLSLAMLSGTTRQDARSSSIRGGNSLSNAFLDDEGAASADDLIRPESSIWQFGTYSADATLGWFPLPGLAQDVAVGGDGSVYLVATANDENEYGYGVYKWAETNWEKQPGDATRVAIDSQGNPWLINKQGNIWRRFSDGTWQQLPGQAQEIAIGGGGLVPGGESVYIVATSADENEFGFGIYKWTGTNWSREPGDAVKIAVDPTGSPWLVNKQGSIWRRFSDGQWQQLPGLAREISIGRDGHAYIVATDRYVGGYGIYQWQDTNWAQIPGSAVKIGVYGLGRLVAVKDDSTIHVTGPQPPTLSAGR